MPITSVRIIEHAHRQIGHPIRKSRISQNHLIHIPLHKLIAKITRSSKMTAVQIPLAHSKHIDQNQQRNSDSSLNLTTSTIFRMSSERLFCRRRHRISPKQQYESKYYQ